ncbi:LLM class flavin-dependent oxidoreductase [Protofrankia symbiont of Coriaria ruscifolia]|uniref:LLM class flavin-dependent oxidoreductase n=1 Tax=Protofrankia symbiont of Coriaria ruscifolia TaxID=1306542 RepID=UPI0010419E78|nr:LLM class flavin-dependent oxidoreductase [Protofrankia symbiont of Coriaria ruscifolia]
MTTGPADGHPFKDDRPSREDRPFKLGFLTHVFGREEPAELLRRLVELFVAGEELGFDGGWISQHHFSPRYGRLPSPLVLLAAAAQATRRIELGTAVVVLPLENPIRVAEDAAVVDALSGGRLQLGLGTGGPSSPAFAAFGRDADARRESFTQAIGLLRDLLRGGDVPGTDGLRLQPPAPALASRLWDSTSNAAGAAAAALAGDGLLLGVGPAGSAQRPLADMYLRAHAAAHSAATTKSDDTAFSAETAHPGNRPAARIAVAHGVFPGPGRLTAQRDLAADIACYRPYLAHFGLPDTADDAAVLDAMNVHHGPVDMIVESLTANPVGPGFASYFIAAVQGEAGEAASFDATLRRMELIATEIAPALGWRPATAEPVRAGVDGRPAEHVGSADGIRRQSSGPGTPVK